MVCAKNLSFRFSVVNDKTVSYTKRKIDLIIRYQRTNSWYFDLHDMNYFNLYRHLSGFTIILLCSENETGNIKW